MWALTKRSVFFLLLVTAWNGCGWQTKPARISSPDSRLVELMVRRLDLARQVAWIKYLNDLPVYDAGRERELLASLVAQGVREGLPASEVQTFFAAQIRASRQVQTDLIQKWKRGALLPAFSPADLGRDIRPRLDAVSAEMVRELKRLKGLPAPPGLAARAHRAIRAQGYSFLTAHFSVAPLNAAASPR